MIEFFASLVLFVAAHMVPTRAPIRAFAVRRLGERGFLIAYSALSILMLGWVIAASLRAPFVALWTPAPWAFLVPIIIMPVSFMLLSAALIQPNPLSISFSRRPFDPRAPGVIALTRHPVLWSFGLWAGAHIPPNGDLVSVVLFGVLALFAFAGMARLERKKKLSLGADQWRKLAANTSIIPGAALARGRSSWPTQLGFHAALIAGLALYVLFLIYTHEQLFGAAPLAHL